MNQDCPIYSNHHFVSPSNNGLCTLQTKRGITPVRTGKYLVNPLHPQTRAQIKDREDQGQAAAEQEQQNNNRRIARRIPQLIKSNPHNHLMKIYGFIGGYDKNRAVQFVTENSNMSDVTHVIYEKSQEDLKQYVGETGIPETQTALKLAYQLIIAIEHLHGPVGVMHRRLNPEAIYIFDKDETLFLKVGNILFARKTTNAEMTAERNVPLAYAAPETLRGPGSETATYSLPADIWSYGMVLYFITHKQDPFGKDVAGHGSITLREHLLVETNRPELGAEVDELLKQIIRDCWKVRPEDRPTAMEIKKRLEARSNPNPQA